MFFKCSNVQSKQWRVTSSRQRSALASDHLWVASEDPSVVCEACRAGWNASLHIRHGIFVSQQKTEILWSDAFCLLHVLVPITFILTHSKWRFVPFLPMQLPPPQWGEVPDCGGAQRSSVSGPSRSGARSVCRSKVHLENPFGQKNDDDDEDTKMEPFQNLANQG